MQQSGEHFESIAALFREQPCWTIDSLAASLEYSVPSVRRFLSRHGYFSSFTHNGAWYTLVGVPRFGRDGLWFHRDNRFFEGGQPYRYHCIARGPQPPRGHVGGRPGKKASGTLPFGPSGSFAGKTGFVGSRPAGLSSTSPQMRPQEPGNAKKPKPAGFRRSLCPRKSRCSFWRSTYVARNRIFAQLAASMARRGVYVDASRIHSLFDLHGLEKKNLNSGGGALRALKACLDLLKKETSVAALFPRPPIVRFRCETRTCCGRGELTVLKTRRKTVQSLAGPFVARETLLECGVCSKVHSS